MLVSGVQQNDSLLHIHVSAAAAKLLQSCPTLCDPRDGSPSGSPIPGILQARTLEWVAVSFSNMGSTRELKWTDIWPDPRPMVSNL